MVLYHEEVALVKRRALTTTVIAWIFIPLILMGFFGCKGHVKTKEQISLEKHIQNCDYTPDCLQFMGKLYNTMKAEDKNTPYWANLRLNATRITVESILLDAFEVKNNRIKSICNALGIKPKTRALLEWSKKEAGILKSIPGVKKEAKSLEQLIAWIYQPTCKAFKKAINTWDSEKTPERIRPVYLLFGEVYAFKTLTMYPAHLLWLHRDTIKHLLVPCMGERSEPLSRIMTGLYALVSRAVTEGLNHPDAAVATASLEISKTLQNQGVIIPLDVEKGGKVLGVDMPKSIRPVRMHRHPEYLFVVTQKDLKVVIVPKLKGLVQNPEVPKTTEVTSYSWEKGIPRCSIKDVAKALQGLKNSWTVNGSPVVPILVDRRVEYNYLSQAGKLAAGALNGYPVIMVYDINAKIPGYIPFNVIAPDRGFIGLDGRLIKFNKKLRPITITVDKDKVVVNDNGKENLFDISVSASTIPDFREFYKYLFSKYNSDAYLDVKVMPHTPVWIAVAVTQTVQYRVPQKALTSAQGFLGAGVGKEVAKKMPKLFNRIFFEDAQ